jgi:hypothetical protein
MRKKRRKRCHFIVRISCIQRVDYVSFEMMRFCNTCCRSGYVRISYIRKSVKTFSHERLAPYLHMDVSDLSNLLLPGTAVRHEICFTFKAREHIQAWEGTMIFVKRIST